MSDPATLPGVVPSEPGMPVPDGSGQSPARQSPARDRRRRWRWALAVAVPLLVLGGLYLAGWLYAGSTVPRGTTVLGIDIGGQTRDEAEATLTEQLPPIADAPLRLLVGADTYEIVPSQSGLNVDVTATVQAAGPGAVSPLTLAQAVFRGGGPVDPVVVVDDDELAQAVATVAEQADRQVVEGAVAFADGAVVPTQPVDGRAVDHERSAQTVAEAYLTTSGPIPLPADVQPATITAAEVERAVTAFGAPAMSAPVVVRSDLGSTELTPAQLSAVLSMQPDDEGVLQPRIDEPALLASTAEQLKALGREPVDASVTIQGGSQVVVPSQDGQAVDTAGLATGVLAAAAATGEGRVVTLPLVLQPATFTTEQAGSSGVSQVVGEFTTYYPHADFRNQNIGRAAELANNTFLKPGDTFSMNDVVGQRTEARGFTEGFIIDGGRYTTGVGGGVSQLATTLYNAAHFAGFTDVEHHPHSFYIDRYPMGREATVSWGSWDLRFKNNTPHGAVVQSFITPSSPGNRGSVTVRIWSTPYWQVQSSIGAPFNFTDYSAQQFSGEGCVGSSGSRGFDVVVTRTLSRDGAVQATEEDFVRYQPTPQVTCT